MSSFDIPQPMTTGIFPQDLQNQCQKFVQVNITLPKTNVAPEKWWLGNDFPCFEGLLSGGHVSFCEPFM